MRLDVKPRVNPAMRRVTVNIGGGPVTVDLTLGEYAGLAALCAEAQTRLQVVDATFTCTESAGVVTIARGAGVFTLAWTHPPLRDWLGWAADLAAAASYTAPAMSPATVIGTLPWSEPAPVGLELHLRRWRGEGQTGGSVRLAGLRVWEVEALVLAGDDLPQLRSVLSLMGRGAAARWWRDTTIAAAWSWVQWWGYLDVVLSPEMRAYSDTWSRDDLQYALRVPLTLTERTAAMGYGGMA